MSDRQNNHVEILTIISNDAKSFDILAISLMVLHNYFDNPTKSCLNLHLAFINTSVKLSFPYIISQSGISYRVENFNIKDIEITIIFDNHYSLEII